MGIVRIKNLSSLTDSAAVARVGMYIGSHSEALTDSSGKQIININHNPISFGFSEYIVSDVDMSF